MELERWASGGGSTCFGAKGGGAVHSKQRENWKWIDERGFERAGNGGAWVFSVGEIRIERQGGSGVAEWLMTQQTTHVGQFPTQSFHCITKVISPQMTCSPSAVLRSSGLLLQ
mmetsp:Transcript_4136/g.15574  ORF Transcript_4136/g.15574 Transcript_4136/m.15574 type:complete len:113 (+) Transcript_4136:1820-2158(+)